MFSSLRLTGKFSSSIFLIFLVACTPEYTRPILPAKEMKKVSPPVINRPLVKIDAHFPHPKMGLNSYQTRKNFEKKCIKGDDQACESFSTLYLQRHLHFFNHQNEAFVFEMKGGYPPLKKRDREDQSIEQIMQNLRYYSMKSPRSLPHYGLALYFIEQKLESYKILAESCNLNSAVGCHLLALLLEIDNEIQKSAMARARACELGIKKLCP